ncbi:MAG: serine protease [Bacilli bacterium]|jgi:hypothetical protein|nr:serine protease [Bacilli bacterium]
MFQNAINTIKDVTFPLIVNTHMFSGESKTSFGTAILLNNDGFFLTCAHMFLLALQFEKDKVELSKFNETLQSITCPDKRKKFMKKANPEWITNLGIFFPKYNTGVDPSTVRLNLELDLAIFKVLSLPSFEPTIVFPTFNKTKAILPGTSFCRLGFPFKTANVNFDKEKNMFNMDFLSSLNVIPNDGIITQFINNISPVEVQGIKRSGSAIETSTPGLRGQSGGPIFDVDGIILGLQSFTTTTPLDIDGIVKNKKFPNKKDEHFPQFILFGVGISSSQICSFLDAENIAYNLI